MSLILGFALLVTLPLAAAGYASYRRDLATARLRARSGSQLVSTRSGNMEYASEGHGPAVLVLHGASGGWDQGLACARALVARGFLVIAPSRFGYLRTALPADASPEAEADALADLLDAVNIARLPVMAFSAGAATAVQMALRHPARVSRLVLFVPGAGGLYAGRAAAPPRIALEALYRFDLVMWLLMRLAPRFMSRLVGVPPSAIASLTPHQQTMADEIVASILPAAPRRPGLSNEGRTQRPGREYPLGGITAPTLVISAADDPYQTLPVARHAVSLIPNSRLIEFATGGHLLFGHDDEIWPAVAAFLRPRQAKAHTAA
jgi:2-hydroxy-6-oxonona-2,4-dienedioate hydrolase